MIPTLFSEKDMKLIMRYCAEYPDLWDRLNGFLWLSPEYRPKEALKFLKHVIRSEWLSFGLEHEEIDDLFVFKRKMINFNRHNQPEHLDRLGVRMRIWAYDLPHAIMGKSRGDEPIPAEDFQSLQRIAAEMLYSDPMFKANLKALKSLISDNTEEDRWVNDIERLLLLNHLGVSFYHKHGEKFDSCWNDFRPKWKTMDGMMKAYTMRYQKVGFSSNEDKPTTGLIIPECLTAQA